MASSIGSTGDFNIVNMKPDPDEQVDALWGQNIGDDSGYLRWNKMWATRRVFSLGPSICHVRPADGITDDGTVVGTQTFMCLGTDAQGTITGTLTISLAGDAITNGDYNFYINGNSVASGNLTSPGQTVTAFNYVMDNTYDIGSFYDASCFYGGHIAGGADSESFMNVEQFSGFQKQWGF